MRFDDNRIYCEDCSREIAESDDQGWEDHTLCSGCAARDMQEHVKKPCGVCGKPLGEEEVYYNTDDHECFAHEECVMESDNPDEWSNDYW